MILFAFVFRSIETLLVVAQGRFGGGALFLVAFFTAAFCLATADPRINLTIRRFHDVGLPGWVVFLLIALFALFALAGPSLAVATNRRELAFVSLLAPLTLLVVAVWPPTRGPNRYGARPYKKNREA